MSSNIPFARTLIEKSIKDLRDPTVHRSAIAKVLRHALRQMTRKSRTATAEPRARKAYMTQAMIVKIRQYKNLYPDQSARKIAGVFGTDLRRTKAVLGETK